MAVAAADDSVTAAALSILQGPPKALVICQGSSKAAKNVKNVLKKHKVVFDLCLNPVVGVQQYEDCAKLKYDFPERNLENIGNIIRRYL